MSKKIGRNDPCPCGSQKKYKKCCLLKEEQRENIKSVFDDVLYMRDKMLKFGEDMPKFELMYQNCIGNNYPYLETNIYCKRKFFEWIFLNKNIFEDLSGVDELKKTGFFSKTTLEIFLSMYNKEERLGPEAKKVIENWNYPLPSLYRVKHLNTGQDNTEEFFANFEDAFNGYVYRVILSEDDLSYEDLSYIEKIYTNESEDRENLFFITLVESPVADEYIIFNDIFLVPVFYEKDIMDRIKNTYKKVKIVNEIANLEDHSSKNEFATDFNNFYRMFFPLVLIDIFDVFEDYELMSAFYNAYERKWKKDIYREAAEIFLNKMYEEQTYPAHLINISIKWWYLYSNNRFPGVKKPEGAAAALELLTAEDNRGAKFIPTRTGLADRYNTTTSSISRYEEKMEAYFDELTEEEWDWIFGAGEKETDVVDDALEEVYEFEDETCENRERARELIFKAYNESDSKKQVSLAEKALNIYPDPDAYVILGNNTDNMEKARDYYYKGIKAGEEELGEKFFKENRGYFWKLSETRPYMRAREHYAISLLNMEFYDDARREFSELLKLNPDDNQGNRHELLIALLEDALKNPQNKNKRVNEAKQVVMEYSFDNSTHMKYSKLLIEYIQNGFKNKEKMDKLIKEAINANPYIIEYFKEEKYIPLDIEQLYPGEESEAAVFLADTFKIWEKCLSRELVDRFVRIKESNR